jgi:hypothetical protein
VKKMSNGSPWFWIVTGIVIIGCIIGGIFIYNKMKEGQQFIESEDWTGFATWFAGIILVAIILVGIIIIFSRRS